MQQFIADSYCQQNEKKNVYTNVNCLKFKYQNNWSINPAYILKRGSLSFICCVHQYTTILMEQ